METERVQSLVVGGGPAGLMAAGELAHAGQSVVLTEAKPTVARKFLMAGKSGLNLTKDEPGVVFRRAFHGSCAGLVARAVADFGPGEVTQWANTLGQEVFTGSSGRVFPVSMKASPLLRAWLADLDQVAFHTRWRWAGFDEDALIFETPSGRRRVVAERVVLALGGASWPRLGSDAAWVPWLAARGVEIAPFAPANVGLSVPWSGHMEKHFGKPVKAARVLAGDMSVRGEFVISARGLEGSAIYAVSRAVREGATLTLDLCPDWDVDEVARRLARLRGKSTVANHLRKVLNLDPVKIALIMEWARPLPDDLTPVIKSLPVRHAGPRPMSEAISSAGGITAAALTDYRLRAVPHVFAAGEMLDWEAPTGGYLITACLATGRAAAIQAMRDMPG